MEKWFLGYNSMVGGNVIENNSTWKINKGKKISYEEYKYN